MEQQINGKNHFSKLPYLRDELVRYGVIIETFETATTWSNFPSFHQAIENAANEAIKKYCGKGFITCRFTHLYPDGPAPYYTIFAAGKINQELEQWDQIKKSSIQCHYRTRWNYHSPPCRRKRPSTIL